MDYYKNLDLEDIKYFCDITLINKTEIWEDINGYKSLYQISNKGNVRSLDRIIFYEICICLNVG